MKKFGSSLLLAAAVIVIVGGLFALVKHPHAIIIGSGDANATSSTSPAKPALPTTVDAAAYNAKLLSIANLTIKEHVTRIKATTSTPSSTIITTSTIPFGWPAKAPLPLTGALLPFNRIVAYYGNFYSTAMGILGEYPEQEVLAKLASTTAEWQQADPSTPVIPAIQYIAVTAQGSPQKDGTYRARMPDSQIDKALAMAAQIHGVVFLDVQVGLSSVEKEVPLLEQYLKMPQVNLAIDPEFAMHNGARPGTVIGSMDATDVNFVANYLAGLVRANNLPPKILVVHRFTQAMVMNAQNITPLPEVQIVMDMDGFGPPDQKLTTYRDFIQSEPVQFTGFKLFYKNDARAGHLLTPAEVLKVSPQPSYIQYQ